MSVKQAQQEIDSAEFAEWIAWFEIQPFGDERADLRSAIVATTIANAHRSKSSSAFKVSDFMPEFQNKKPSKAQSPEYIKAVLFSLANINNGNNSKPKR